MATASLPEWITKELLEKALREFFKSEAIQILECTSKNAVGKGENFASDLYRTSIVYKNGRSENKKISLIIKCLPTNEIMLETLKELKRFDKEIEFYTEILPEFNQSLGDVEPLTPNCVYSVNDEQKLLIFEDLAPSGFKVANRCTGLDLEHSLLVIEKIAQFHAASLVLFEKNPGVIAKHTEGEYANTDPIKYWIKTSFDMLIKLCLNWPGFEKYGRKLQALGDKLIAKSMDSTKARLGSLKVLNHGDVWTTNFMFSYGLDGKPNNVRFLDFQLIVHSSPIIDLHYFWCSSTTFDVKKWHLDTLLDHYYSTLLVTLTKNRYSLERIPTRQQLRDEFNAKAFYGVLQAATNLPLVILPPEQNSSGVLDAMMANDNSGGLLYECYNNKEYKKLMEFLLPFYDDLGVMD